MTTKLRTGHLPGIRLPQLFVQGTNDPFIDPHSQLEDAVASVRTPRSTGSRAAGTRSR